MLEFSLGGDSRWGPEMKSPSRGWCASRLLVSALILVALVGAAACDTPTEPERVPEPASDAGTLAVSEARSCADLARRLDQQNLTIATRFSDGIPVDKARWNSVCQPGTNLRVDSVTAYPVPWGRLTIDTDVRRVLFENGDVLWGIGITHPTIALCQDGRARVETWGGTKSVCNTISP